MPPTFMFLQMAVSCMNVLKTHQHYLEILGHTYSAGQL